MLITWLYTFFFTCAHVFATFNLSVPNVLPNAISKTTLEEKVHAVDHLTKEEMDHLAASQLEHCMIKYSAKIKVTRSIPSTPNSNMGVFKRDQKRTKTIPYINSKPSIGQIGYTPLKASRFTTFWTVDVYTLDGQILRMMWDSGSSMTIVNPDAYIPSSKFPPTNSRVDVGYFDGTTGGGPVHNDILHIGGLTVSTSLILSDTPVMGRGADGVIGVGFSDSTAAVSLIEAMVQNFTLPTDIISMTMTNNGHGALTLGTIDANIINELEYTDILTRSGHAWDVSMTVNDLPSFTGFIDTGTTYMFLPMPTAEALFKKLGLETEQGAVGGPFDTLWARTDCHSAPPEIYVTIGISDTKYSFNPTTVLSWTGDGCRLSIVGTTIEHAIVGGSFLKNVHLVFDRDKYKLGFAQRYPQPDEFKVNPSN